MSAYYDRVLGLIPVALLGITALLSVAGVPLTGAVLAGAGVAAALIGHALFVRDPTAAAADPSPGPVNAD